MSSIVQLKRSALSGKVPGTGSLNLGELALNTYDGKIFFRRSGSTDTIQEVVTTNVVNTGSVTLTGTLTAESIRTNLTGSFGSLKVNDTLTVNHGVSIISGSLGVTSDLTVLGAVNAKQFNISIISSSVLFESGSSKFGNTSDDIHSFTGSIQVTGSQNINGNIYISGSTNVNYIVFNSSSAATLQNYMLQANTTDKTLDLKMGNNATLQLGQEMYFPPIVNKSGVDLNDGDLVMVNPAGIAQGNRISVVKAITDGTYAADKIVGVLTEDVANNAEGFATWFGYVRNISKTHIQPAGETWTEGDILYPNPAIPGKLTNVFPTAPNLKVTVATITSINGNNVTILVNFHKRTALKRAHDVLDNSTTSSYGDLLIKSGSVWTNKTPTQIGMATTGSNVFSGSQTITGSVTATSFVGDGSGLTALSVDLGSAQLNDVDGNNIPPRSFAELFVACAVAEIVDLDFGI